jgi:hypothetical protein
MIRLTLAGMATTVSLMFAATVSAQATVQERQVCQLSIDAHGGTAPPAPTADALPPGCETTTRPWSAPVGHRQPQAVDVQAIDVTSSISSIDQALVQENARIDRLIQGVCRGC